MPHSGTLQGARPRIDWPCLAAWFVMAVFDAAVYVGLVWLLLWWLA